MNLDKAFKKAGEIRDITEQVEIKKQEYVNLLQTPWKHKKTGGVYDVICLALNESDLNILVVYRSKENSIIWARPLDEFKDGRFVPV